MQSGASAIVGRRRPLLRAGLWVLAIGQGAPAIWALVAPRSWFDEFPGGGQHWVAAYPPFNEHLVADYGAGYLAISVLAATSAVLLERRLVIVAMACWLVASVPHLAFHVGTVDAYRGAEAIAGVGALVLSTALSLLILIAAWRPPAAEAAQAPR